MLNPHGKSLIENPNAAVAAALMDVSATLQARLIFKPCFSSKLEQSKAFKRPPVFINFKLAPSKTPAAMKRSNSSIPWIDSSRPIGIWDRFLSSRKLLSGKFEGINCSAN